MSYFILVYSSKLISNYYRSRHLIIHLKSKFQNKLVIEPEMALPVSKKLITHIARRFH